MSIRPIVRNLTRTPLSNLTRTATATIVPRSLISSRTLTTTPKMASTIQSAIKATAQSAHSAFASLADVSPVKVGDAVPNVDIKINDLEDKINFSTLPGKNVLVLVPGAFSPTCSSQVPGYLDNYSAFSSKGVKGIYVVSVNDMFVMNAWKEKLLGEKKDSLQFAADDASSLASALGLVLDAQAIFGGPRFKRGALVIEDGKVLHVAVEASPADVTVSHADEVLKAL